VIDKRESYSQKEKKKARYMKGGDLALEERVVARENDHSGSNSFRGMLGRRRQRRFREEMETVFLGRKKLGPSKLEGT